MPSAKNDRELMALIIPQLEKVVEYMVEQIWKENQDIVEQIVYGAYSPVDYNRTGEFKEAWDTKTSSDTYTGKATGEFKYAPEKMSVGASPTDYGSSTYGQHASAVSGVDSRRYLADIIYQGLSVPAFGHGTIEGAWHDKRNAWKELQKRIGITKIRQYFEEGMRRNGLSFRRRKGGIGVRRYEEK